MALVGLLLAVVADGLVVANRIRHVDIALPIAPGGAGENYVILGSDSRADLPAGVSSRIGTTEQVAGARADVVLVVHVGPDGTPVTVAIPRDLLVQDEAGYPVRLTLTLLDGPQATVDALCRSLGIATTHLVIIDFAGFAGVVDAVGGITVDVPHPVRDQISGLDIRTAGAVRLDGLQALALVRSRHPEQFVDGGWAAMDDAAGAAARTRWAGLVFQTLQQAASRARSDPVLLQRLAWTLSGALTTDSGTGPFDLLGLARVAGPPVDLPADPMGGSALGVQVTSATRAAVAAAGMGGGCTART
jgi:LCP family protein required for cell wall assembly